MSKARKRHKSQPVEHASAEPTSRKGLPITHPAFLIAAFAAAACILVTVSFQLTETDMWQHLLVGKAIWQLKEIPTTNLWSWPTHGAPDVNSSWGFRALIYPVWEAGGVWGLYVWRWVTALAAFAMLWFASRRMGARGFTPFLVMALFALTWRYRAQIRPETLVAVLLAAQIWILETRRAGGPDRSLWLIPIAWVWANVHISYHLGFAMIGIHLVNDFMAGQKSGEHGQAHRLAMIGLGALAISFVNPFGWKALWQPFDFFLNQRHETIFQSVRELQPLFPNIWIEKLTTGLPFLVFVWPVLLVLRGIRKGFDLVEVLVCVLYTTLAVSTIRFAGFYALAAAPYVARGLDDFVASRRWPSWTAPAPARAACVIAACIFVSVPEWTRAGMPIRVSILENRYAEAACDYMEANDVRGRGFNPFYMGGYMLWRFWPDETRLPFMDIHQSGTRLERERYVSMFARPNGWFQLNQQYKFDYALLDAAQDPRMGDRSRDAIDTDTTFVLVFRDDAAALYVKRRGPLAAVASRDGYTFVPGGDGRLELLGQACEADSSIRATTRAELDRMRAASKRNSRALSLIANLDLIDGRLDDARINLEEALKVDPALFAAHERLGIIAMEAERWDDAVRELELERKNTGGSPALSGRLALAWQAVGDVAKSRKYYGEAFDMAPTDPALLDSIGAGQGGQ